MRNQIRSERTFENARLWGESVLYAAEIIEAIHYLEGDEPKVEPWTGFLCDPVVRKYGIKMVDWTIPGVAVILGRAKDSKAAKKLLVFPLGLPVTLQPVETQKPSLEISASLQLLLVLN